MSYLLSLVSTIAALTGMLAIGFIGGKTKIIDAQTTEKLSNVVVKIGQPFLIINSLISLEYSEENLKTGLGILALGLCMHAVMALIAFGLSFPFRDLDEQKLSQYSMFFANCGFVGFPIIEAIYGKEWLFYGAFYLISFHLFVWTLGILIFARKRKDIRITPKSILFNWGTMPCLIGFVIFLTHIPLPGWVHQLSSSLCGIATPLALMISGANLARRNLGKMLSSWKVYWVCAVKLVVMPMAVSTLIWLLTPLGVPTYMIVFGGIMAAMPCAAVVTMFGELYRISPGYAAELVGASTILCTLTIVPVVTYSQWLAGMI